MLTDTEIRALKAREKAFKTIDGGGLYLQTTPKGGRVVQGRLSRRQDNKKLKVVTIVQPMLTQCLIRLLVGEYQFATHRSIGRYELPTQIMSIRWTLSADGA